MNGLACPLKASLRANLYPTMPSFYIGGGDHHRPPPGAFGGGAGLVGGNATKRAVFRWDGTATSNGRYARRPSAEG
jgi:hypothetical protein